MVSKLGLFYYINSAAYYLFIAYALDMKKRNKSSKPITPQRYSRDCKYISKRYRSYLSQIATIDNDSAGSKVVVHRCPLHLPPGKCKTCKYKPNCGGHVIKNIHVVFTVIYDPATKPLELIKIKRKLLKHGRLAKSVNRTK